MYRLYISLFYWPKEGRKKEVEGDREEKKKEREKGSDRGEKEKREKNNHREQERIWELKNQ